MAWREMGEHDAFHFGWSYAEMAVPPGVLSWRIREWPERLRGLALSGYAQRRQAYDGWEAGVL